MEVKTETKRLTLDEGVIEEESELFFSGGKDDWQKFWITALAIGQKEREPASLAGSDFVVNALEKR